MKLFNVKWLQIYLACMHSFHSEPILGNLFLPWLGQGDPILGTSDFVDSLINQRRSQFQRSRRAKTGTPSYLSPPYPLALCLVLQRDMVPENEAEQISTLPPHPATPPTSIYSYPTAPPPLSTLTLLAVLHCTILSQQAVQYLRAGGREYGCPEYPKSSLGTPLTPKHWESLQWGLNMLPAWSALSQVLMLVVIHQNFFTECT